MSEYAAIAQRLVYEDMQRRRASDPLYVPGDELAYSTPHRIPWRWLALALVLLIAAWRKLL